MGRVFTFILGKNEQELQSMLEDVNKKLDTDPDNAELIEERSVIEAELRKCVE